MGIRDLADEELDARFLTSGNGERPADWKRNAQEGLQFRIKDAARFLDEATTPKTRRLQAIFLTKLEEALMFGNKAIFSEDN